MAFLNSLDISGSALTAQRLRLDIVSENISNIDTTRTVAGGPYRRKVVQFQPIGDGNFKTALDNAVNRYSGYFTGRHIGVNSSHFQSLRNAPDAQGVRVSAITEDDSPFKTVWDPTHPDADQYGYVQMPNVDLIKEVVDAMSASRSYEANVTAMNAVKVMASKALEVGR